VGVIQGVGQDNRRDCRDAAGYRHAVAVRHSRDVLARWLEPLETHEFLAKAFDNRLTSFIVIPRSVLDEMLQEAGIRGDDET
jgi:hypothetical protein